MWPRELSRIYCVDKWNGSAPREWNISNTRKAGATRKIRKGRGSKMPRRRVCSQSGGPGCVVRREEGFTLWQLVFVRRCARSSVTCVMEPVRRCTLQRLLSLERRVVANRLAPSYPCSPGP